MFEAISRYIFIATVLGLTSYMYWKLYQIYKSAGPSSKKIGFFWFSFYAQTPHFGCGAESLHVLPEQVQLQIATIRNRASRVLGGLLLWLTALILFIAIMERA